MTTRNAALRGLTAGIMLFLALVFTSCGTSEAEGKVAVVSPKRAAVLLERGDRVVIDVRTPEAFAAGHVKGAQSLPLRDDGFDERLEDLDPAAGYLVYSGDGTDAAEVADRMVGRGFTDVVDGGSFGLLAIAGAPVE